MKLYHFTDDAGAAGLRRHGFARSNLLDTPEASWLAATRESAEVTASHDGWIIFVLRHSSSMKSATSGPSLALRFGRVRS